MQLKQLKTIDIEAKEWRDKIYGNSYFSSDVTLNYGMNNEKVIKLPFQYGYGDQYKYEALRELVKEKLLEEKRFPSDQPVKFIKIPNTLKQEAIRFGEI